MVDFNPNTVEVMSCTAFTIDVIDDMPTEDGVQLTRVCRHQGQEEKLISTVYFHNFNQLRKVFVLPDEEFLRTP